MQNAKLLGFCFSPFCAPFSFNFELWTLNFALANFVRMVGPSGLEPPTSCLSGTRSNLLSYEPMWLVSDLSHLVLQCREQISLLSHCVGIELSSRAASSQVFSPLQSLTSVFGMGTGGPSAFVTPTSSVILNHWILNNITHKKPFFVFLNRLNLHNVAFRHIVRSP